MTNPHTASPVQGRREPFASIPRTEQLRRSLLQLGKLLSDAVESLPSDCATDAFAGMRLSKSDTSVLLDRVCSNPLGHRRVQTEVVSPAWFPERVATAFELDDIDIAILLTALAPELDAAFERVYGFLNDDLTIRRPTVGLVTALFSEGDEARIHSLSRFLPESPLMSSNLLHLSREAGLSSGQLSVDERVLKLAITDGDPVDALDYGGVLNRSARKVVWRDEILRRTHRPASDHLVATAAALLPLTEAQIATAVDVCASSGSEFGDEMENKLLEAAVDAYRSPSPLGRHVPIRRTFGRDLILPEHAHAQVDGLLRRMAVHATVRSVSPLAGGLTALFTGPSGTGKTLAAECLAHTLGCELFRVSASRLYDKYVGETEKNIDRMFDFVGALTASAPQSTTILLVDEAEWLFSKRVEGGDAHDHYLNLRVGHLLQRLETYRGMAILTSNLPANLDNAFRRRWFQHVRFPLPDEAARCRLWIHALAQSGAECQRIDTAGLAQAFALSGGGIRNVVVMAMYDACADGTSLQTRHMYDAIAREYQKLGHDIDPIGMMAQLDTPLVKATHDQTV